MKQILLAGLIGAVILFVWSFLAWSVLPIHSQTIHQIRNEDSLVAVMKTCISEKGVYFFPGMPAVTPGMSKEDQAAAMKEVEKRAARGPVGMILYDPQGSGYMMTMQMIVGFVLLLIGSGLAAWFLQRSTAAAGPYLVRVSYCGMLGIFLSVVVFLSDWNWMGYPPDYTIGMIIDAVAGWIIAGLGIAAIVKVKDKAV